MFDLVAHAFSLISAFKNDRAKSCPSQLATSQQNLSTTSSGNLLPSQALQFSLACSAELAPKITPCSSPSTEWCINHRSAASFTTISCLVQAYSGFSRSWIPHTIDVDILEHTHLVHARSLRRCPELLDRFGEVASAERTEGVKGRHQLAQRKEQVVLCTARDRG